MKEILVDFIKKYAPVSDEQAGALADYALSTWQPLPRQVKYLHITGKSGAGKTTLGRVMRAICKNSFSLCGFSSHIGRLYALDMMSPCTLIIEEGDIDDGELQVILQQGYEDTSRIAAMHQVSDSSAELEPAICNVFGHKVIISRNPFQHPAIQSKCIEIELGGNRRDVLDFSDFGNDVAQIQVILRAVYGGAE